MRAQPLVVGPTRGLHSENMLRRTWSSARDAPHRLWSRGEAGRAKQRKDGAWYAELVSQNAPTEDICHFKSASDVRDWIANEANEYFQQRAGL